MSWRGGDGGAAALTTWASHTHTHTHTHTQPLLLWFCSSSSTSHSLELPYATACLEAYLACRSKVYSVSSTWRLILLYTPGSYSLTAVVTQCIRKIFIATPKRDKSSRLFIAAHFMPGQVSSGMAVQCNCGNFGVYIKDWASVQNRTASCWNGLLWFHTSLHDANKITFCRCLSGSVLSVTGIGRGKKNKP